MAEETVQQRVDSLFDEPEEPILEATPDEPVDEVDEPGEPVVEGDDNPEPDEEEVEAPESELVEFEWDGQLLEATPAIKEALMRQSDYTQKTQEVSAQRKSIEVTLGEVEQQKQYYEFAQSVQPDLLKAQQLETTANEAREYIRANLDNLNQSDVMKWQMGIEDARRERDELVQSISTKQQEYQQAQEQSKAELLTKGTEVLRSKIPGWGEESQKQVREYALKSGFTDAEIANVLDPRQVETLWKASQFDSLQEGKAAAVQKVNMTPSIKAKSRNPMPENVKAKLNLRKSLKNPKLSSKAKAKMIEKSFGERFG